MIRSRLVILFTFLIAATAVHATTAVEMDNAALAGSAETILIGTCTDLKSEWVDRVLVTRATIQVSEYLKGSGGETVVVTLPGGADANRKFPVAMTYPGAPELRIGENAFLFLVSDSQYGSVIDGFSQGKYSIIADASGEQFVSRDLTSINLTTGSGTVRGGTASRKKLSELKNEVRSALSAAKTAN